MRALVMTNSQRNINYSTFSMQLSLSVRNSEAPPLQVWQWLLCADIVACRISFFFSGSSFS